MLNILYTGKPPVGTCYKGIEWPERSTKRKMSCSTIGNSRKLPLPKGCKNPRRSPRAQPLLVFDTAGGCGHKEYWGIAKGKRVLEAIAASSAAESFHPAGTPASGHHPLPPLLEQTRAREQEWCEG